MDYNTALNNFKKTKNFPHALLVNTTNCIDTDFEIKKYLKTINCKKESLFCNKCSICSEINDNKYLDLIIIDGSSNRIKKEDIFSIQEKFSKSSSSFNHIKLYALINIENSSNVALNSLLKILEEPYENTYAILFCSNKNNVLDTISSRCQKTTLVADIDNFEINEIDKDYKEIIFKIFTYTSQYNDFLLNSNFKEIYNIIMNLLRDKSVISEHNFIIFFKKQSYAIIDVCINLLIELVSINKKILISEIKSDLNININRSLLAMKIVSILGE